MPDDLKQYLKINKNALDEELVQHSMLFFKVAEAYVRAAAKRDQLKEELAIKDAALDWNIRKRADDDREKVTEPQIKNLVTGHREHIDKLNAYQTAKHEADTLANLKEAFATRGYMLRDLCQLYATQYFDKSSVKPTAQTDQVVYRERRRRLALGRGED